MSIAFEELYIEYVPTNQSGHGHTAYHREIPNSTTYNKADGKTRFVYYRVKSGNFEYQVNLDSHLVCFIF